MPFVQFEKGLQVSIIRGPRPESNFYLLRKSISEDGRLSWAARGLLVYLLGKPDWWKVSIPALIEATAGAAKQSGRDAVYVLLDELIQAGYMTREKQKKQAGNRFDGIDYIVSEIPLTDSPDTAAPHTENTDTGNQLETPSSTEIPLPGFPYPANPQLVSTEFKQEVSTESPRASRGKKLKQKREEKTFAEYRAEFDASGQPIIAEDDPIYSTAEQMGLPDEYIAIAWTAFAAKYVTSDKKYKDWKAAFRNAVREDWLHLWNINRDGDYFLTPAGKMIEKAMHHGN